MQIERICINSNKPCLGRDKIEYMGYQICCKEEICEEIHLALSIVDAIEDCRLNEQHILAVASKLSFAAHIINKNDEAELFDMMPVVHRFALLIFEYRKKILTDELTAKMTCSFAQLLKQWFYHYFVEPEHAALQSNRVASLQADMQSIEMALGVCMIAQNNSELDDLFF